MRTKRSTESKKTTARRPRAHVRSRVTAIASAPAKATSWVSGIDRASLGIAGTAILAAGLLVATYHPAHSDDAGVPIEQVSQAASRTAAPDLPHAATAASKPVDDNASLATVSTWPAPMTITGCLDRDGDSYRLTDADGVGVPRTRSWKTGFLKKNTSTVTLVDAERHIRLKDHLGQRVTVTGTIVNREMQIGSMRFLSESCSEKKRV